MNFWLGLLIGFSFGSVPIAFIAFGIRRKLALSRQNYQIAERIANAMEMRARRNEEALRIVSEKYAMSFQEEERLRSEKLKAWGIPDRM